MLWPATELDAAYSNIIENSLNRGCTVLITVANEGDALCSAAILMKLLQSDNVMYRLKIIDSPKDLNNIFIELKADWEDSTAMKSESTSVTSVVFLDCAGDLDLKNSLGEGFHSRFYYVCDVRRPHNPHNIDNENENVIVFDDLDGFKFESQDIQTKKRKHSNISKEILEDQTESSKDSQSIVSTEEEREEAEETVFSFSSFGPPSSHLFFQLAQQLNRANDDLLWIANTGLCHSFFSHKVAFETYKLVLEEFSNFSTVHSSKSLSLKADHQLFLHRHIPLYSSLVFSTLISYIFGCSSQLADKTFDSFSNTWKYKVEGTYKLNILLARLGFSQDSCSEVAIPEQRIALCDALDKQDSLTNLQFPCYIKSLGYGEELSGKDNYMLLNSLINSKNDDEDAMEFLLNNKTRIFEDALPLAEEQRRVVLCIAQRMISGRKTKSAGDFRFALLSNLVTTEAITVENPRNMMEIAQFVQGYYFHHNKWKDLSFKPLVLGLTIDNDSGSDNRTIFVVAEAPPNQDSRNLRYRAGLEQAALATDANYQMLTFDIPAIKILDSNPTMFLGALHTWLLES